MTVGPQPEDGHLALDAFHRVHAGLLVCNSDGRILLANGAAGVILGYENGLPPGCTIEDVMGSFESLEHSHGEPEVTFERPWGRIVVGYQLIQGDDDRRILILQDVTRTARLREERERLRRLASVDEVLPTVLHELRNPLAAVTSSIEVLMEERELSDDADLQKALAGLLIELRRMSLIFHGIGVVGRRLRSERTAAIDVAVREVVEVMARRAEQGGIRLTFEQRPLPPLPPLPFDPTVFKAVVFNLINNAIYACREGGHIQVRLELPPNGSLILQVEDNGEGMSNTVLATCTRPFFTTRPNGSGLGLAICREAIEGAGGFIVIESAIGRGTRIQIGLPVTSAWVNILHASNPAD